MEIMSARVKVLLRRSGSFYNSLFIGLSLLLGLFVYRFHTSDLFIGLTLVICLYV